MEDWLQRWRTGDPEAFAGLFEQYKNLVYHTAFLMLGDREEAEDALQEVFLQVYRSLHTYDPAKGALTTWLHRITVNHCLNRQRKKRPALLSLDFLQHGSDQAGAPAMETQLGEDEALYQAIRRLSDPLRAAVVLRYFLDLSYAEIARVLDIPIGTVKSRLNQALRSLQAWLDTDRAESATLQPLLGQEKE